MDNRLSFINSEFNYILDNVSDSAKILKPSIVVSHGLTKTKHIAITWQQFEHIKQYLIDSEKGK